MKYSSGKVAPLVGAWIEISHAMMEQAPLHVAPLVGAWIEITKSVSDGTETHRSLPSWERGLKLLIRTRMRMKQSRSPRGSVD